MLKNKAAGFYFAIIACVIGIISMIRFVMWAPKHGSIHYRSSSGNRNYS